MAVLGLAYTYRRRRRTQQEAQQAPDLESGAFPGLTPESESKNNDDQQPQDASFQDASFEEARVVSPSSLAALGTASTLVARQYSHDHSPENSRPSSPADPLLLNTSLSDQDDTSMHDSQRSFDMAPVTQESNSFDMTPISPTDAAGGNDDGDDESRTSDEKWEELDNSNVAPQISPSESTLITKNGPPGASEGDGGDDDSDESGLV